MEEGARRPTRQPRDRGPELDRLILDTSILISVEKTAISMDELIGDEDDVAIAAVTVADLLVGVELASTRRRPAREAFVEAVLRTIPVEPYDLDIARSHSRLLAWTRRSGKPRGAHDLIIAATAFTRGRIVVTADPDGFRGLPDVFVRAP